MARIGDVFKKEENVKKAVHPSRITKWIHYSKLKRNAKQYCDAKDKQEIEQLADLIEADGEVLQDLLVRKIDADEYEIIGGHKRKAACELLVEERGLKQFEFLPCIEKNLSDVRAEFQIYSSNNHHVETAYEIMHKVERMQYLLENYPEEFPHLQKKGRMVERLAEQLSMSRSTVGEYQKISAHLSEQAMEEFKNNKIDKTAALSLTTFSEKEQNELLQKDIKTAPKIKEYKKSLELKDSISVPETKENNAEVLPTAKIYNVQRKDFFRLREGEMVALFLNDYISGEEIFIREDNIQIKCRILSKKTWENEPGLQIGYNLYLVEKDR